MYFVQKCRKLIKIKSNNKEKKLQSKQLVRANKQFKERK